MSIGIKKCLKNTMAVLEKTFIRSSQMTNHGCGRMSPKQSNSPPCGSLNRSQIQWKFVCGKSLRSKWWCFFGRIGHVATVPLEQRRTVNSEWYTTISSDKYEERTRESLLTQSMKALTHRFKSGRFWPSKRLIDRSPAVQSCLGLFLFPNTKKNAWVTIFAKNHFC